MQLTDPIVAKGQILQQHKLYHLLRKHRKLIFIKIKLLKQRSLNSNLLKTVLTEI